MLTGTLDHANRVTGSSEPTVESSDDQALQERANELYWTSDESVNQIAEDLELSKGALYGLVVPRPAGLGCPRCGAEMEYPNRTARERGHLTCPACELEEDEEVVRSGEAGSTGAEAGPGAVGSASTLNRKLLGAALLGTAAGVALTVWARRK